MSAVNLNNFFSTKKITICEIILEPKLKISYHLFRWSHWLTGTLSFNLPRVSGRPTAASISGGRSMRRKRIQTLTQYSLEDLREASRIKLHNLGLRGAARKLRRSPGVSSPIVEVIPKLTPEEGTEMLVLIGLSKAKYESLREFLKCKVKMPSYPLITRAKRESYPDESTWIVNDASVEIPLQALLDHTIKRILPMVEGSLLKDSTGIMLICKWGMDGSSGHSNYKQLFQEAKPSRDSSLLMESLVPLGVVAKSISTGEPLDLWVNSRTSSTRFCIPMGLFFDKESEELVLERYGRRTEEVEALKSTEITLSGGEVIQVMHQMLPTMFDGKVRNIVCGNKNSQMCHVCKIPMHLMNDWAKIEEYYSKSDGLTYKYGLAPLHARIRFLAHVLNVSYRLEMKKWKVNAALFAPKKEHVQRQFKERTGLLIDVVRQEMRE